MSEIFSQILKYINKKKFSLCLGLMFFFLLYAKTFKFYPFTPCDWNSVILTFSYKYGFIQRGFLGTIIHAITHFLPSVSGSQILIIFQYVTMLIFSISIIAIGIWSIHKLRAVAVPPHQKYCVYSFISVFYICSFGYTTYYSSRSFGHSDIWLILLTVLALILIWHNKFLPAFICSIICMCIHQAYIFMYFNIFLIALLLILAKEQHSNLRAKIIVAFICSFITCSALFVYFQFFSGVKANITYDYVREQAISLTNSAYVDKYENYIKNYLFHAPSPSSYADGLKNCGRYLRIELIAILPFIIELVHYWHDIVKQTNNIFRKIVYMASPLGIITTVPLFIMHTDYGRWIYSIYFYELTLIWLINSLDDNTVTLVTRQTIQRIQNNIIYYSFLFVYACSLGPLDKNQVRDFYYFFRIFLENM